MRVSGVHRREQVLNIREDAAEDDVRQAKRVLSLQTHPDKTGQSPGNAAAFQRVLEAAEILIDDTSRINYDRELEAMRFSGLNLGMATWDEAAASQIYEETGVDVDHLDSCTFQIYHFRISPLKDKRTKHVFLSATFCCPPSCYRDSRKKERVHENQSLIDLALSTLQPFYMDVRIAKKPVLACTNSSWSPTEPLLLHGTVTSAKQAMPPVEERCGWKNERYG